MIVFGKRTIHPCNNIINTLRWQRFLPFSSIIYYSAYKHHTTWCDHWIYIYLSKILDVYISPIILCHFKSKFMFCYISNHPTQKFDIATSINVFIIIASMHAAARERVCTFFSNYLNQETRSISTSEFGSLCKWLRNAHSVPSDVWVCIRHASNRTSRMNNEAL